MTIEQLIDFATNAHAGQLDKGGKPYIFHPLRLMLQCETFEEQAVALLHDVLEDTKENPLGLELPQAVLQAILDLTRIPKQDYFDYIRAIKTNPLATKIKLLDLADNMDLRRLERIRDSDLKRFDKYSQAKFILNGDGR